jgi:hypothetical protein
MRCERLNMFPSSSHDDVADCRLSDVKPSAQLSLRTAATKLVPDLQNISGREFCEIAVFPTFANRIAATKVAAIHGLFGTRRPSDVSRFVMAIIIFAVYAVLRRRSRPQCSKKLLKGSETKLDATSSVVSPMGIPGVTASLFCSFVSSILSRSRFAVFRLPVFGHHIPLQASTTLTLASAQERSAYNFDGGAVALHKPSRSFIRGSSRENLPSSKTAPGKVDQFAHLISRAAIFLLFAAPTLVSGQALARYDAPFPSISSSTPTPFLVANIPPNSPVLAVCNYPANAVPCTNYAQVFTSTGATCPSGAQDTPQPQPSACQSTGDAQGNIGFFAPPGIYAYTVCIENSVSCFGPYEVILGASNGSLYCLLTGGSGCLMTGDIEMSDGMSLEGTGAQGSIAFNSTGGQGMVVDLPYILDSVGSAGNPGDVLTNVSTSLLGLKGNTSWGNPAALNLPKTCQTGLGDGLNAIPNGTYLQFFCVNDSGRNLAITAIHCYTDNAGSSTLNAKNNAGTGLLTGAITCNNTKTGGGAAGTQSATTILAAGDAVNFTFIADGTSTQTTWTVSLTQQ